MVVDTSALVALLYEEPEAERYAQLIFAVERCLLSVANYRELTMVLGRSQNPDRTRSLDTFLKRSGISLEPITVEQGYLARQAFLDFGKGRHPAGLNFGDCFAYALAQATREPLLYKGDNFRQTDIASAS